MFAIGIGMQPLNTAKNPNRKATSRFQPVAQAPPTPFSDLLLHYSGIPIKQQRAHVQEVRDEIYDDHPYPCLGLFRFMQFEVCRHPMYNSYILPTLTQSTDSNDDDPRFLDLGTCLSQDLRFLRHHAKPPIPANRLWGADIHPAFIEAGYKLFRDENFFPRDHLLAPVNVLSLEGTNDKLSVLDGKVAVVQINSVFHLFDMEAQVQCARRIVRVLDLTPSSGDSSTPAASSSSAAGNSKKSKGGGLFGKLSKVTSGTKSGLGSTGGKKKALIVGSQIGSDPPGPPQTHGAAVEVGSVQPNNNHHPEPVPMPPNTTDSSSALSQAYRHNHTTWISFWHSTVHSAIENDIFTQRDGSVVRGDAIHFEAHCQMVQPNVDIAAEWRGRNYRWLTWWVWVWTE